MTIEIFEDKIVFGNGHTISETSDGSGLTVNSNFYSKKIKLKSHFQGEVSGYTSGGRTPPVFTDPLNTIDKFSFTSDGNATDVGDLTQARESVAGQSSSESGYSSGGFDDLSTPTITNTIDKFPFATDADATTVGGLYQARYGVAGQSSTVSGYTSGGFAPPYVNTIDKFPFATDADATDVGDLTLVRNNVAGHSSSEYGYTSAGYNSGIPSPYVTRFDIIDKFPFASDANATDVGNLQQAKYDTAGQSSATHGYTSGGQGGGFAWSIIDKFPFATDTNATAVGNQTQIRSEAAGQSSVTHGYTSGGNYPQPSAGLNTIDKFPFAIDADATDVGDLTQARQKSAGQQV